MQKTAANTAGGVATAFIGISFILSVFAFIILSNSQTENPSLVVNCFEWFNFGGLHIPFELRIDKLSSLMILIITGIGTLIHLYSISYMHDEECVGRYFAYLNLFGSHALTCPRNNLPLLFWMGGGWFYAHIY